MVALSQLHANSGIHHVFTGTEGTAHAEHGIFIRAVECAYRYGMSIFVVAVTGCEIPLIIRVEIKGMKGCQCCSARSYTVHTGSQFAYFIGYIFDILRRRDAGNGIGAAVITSEVQRIPAK